MKRLPKLFVRGGCPLLVVATVLTIGIFGKHPLALAQSGGSFAITSTPPVELNPSGGGPAQATLQQAAEFAWEEFFALSWPAVPQNGKPNERDNPSSTCALGDRSASCAGPLVWQTYRSKVELFPAVGDPAGYNPTAPSFGYDALPKYTYSPSVAACPGSTELSPTVWINLDETDQITLDSMYAGVVAETPSAKNSAPQLIRFLAKANRTEYEYLAKHQVWDDPGAIVLAASNYVKEMREEPPNGDNYLLLPPGSIEVKAGWRVLNPSEVTSGRYHTANVQYYELEAGVPCYQQAVFGLVALHIIQKTPLAPYFIYATFEQADNILDKNGQPIEDVDGATIRQQSCRGDQKKLSCPTTPSVTINDTPTVSSSEDRTPPRIELVPQNATYCTDSVNVRPKNQLYYLNTATLPALPNLGFICVNKRDNAIQSASSPGQPDAIVDTNKRAHDLIRTYSSQHGVTNSVWQYYKLINVQSRPIDKKHDGLYGASPGPGERNFANANNPSSYYLSNIVVETNRTLQLFSGGLISQGASGSNSDFGSQFPFPGTTGPGTSGSPTMATATQPNMFYQGSGYNMGGCMGCHGGQGQIVGGDFSVIVARGRVGEPETPSYPTIGGAAVMFRNRSLR